MNSIIEKYCSEEWCEFVEFHSKKVLVNKGDFIFSSGDNTEGLHIILTGKVKIITKTGLDTERIIRLAADNDIIGHRGFGDTWKYTVSAVALENTELQFIPLKVFNSIIHGNPSFAYFMMMFFAEELRESERLATQLPIKNIIASVLHYNFEVFGFAEGSKTKLAYSLSRKDLASQAGTRYETLVRTLADFVGEGVILTEGKSIHILDVKKLLAIKEGNN